MGWRTNSSPRLYADWGVIMRERESAKHSGNLIEDQSVSLCRYLLPSSHNNFDLRHDKSQKHTTDS